MKQRDVFLDARLVQKYGKFLGPCSLEQPRVIRNHCLVMLMYEGEEARAIDVTDEQLYQVCFLTYLRRCPTVRIKLYSVKEEALQRFDTSLKVWVGDYDAK